MHVAINIRWLRGDIAIGGAKYGLRAMAYRIKTCTRAIHVRWALTKNQLREHVW